MPQCNLLHCWPLRKLRREQRSVTLRSPLRELHVLDEHMHEKTCRTSGPTAGQLQVQLLNSLLRFLFKSSKGAEGIRGHSCVLHRLLVISYVISIFKLGIFSRPFRDGERASAPPRIRIARADRNFRTEMPPNLTRVTQNPKKDACHVPSVFFWALGTCRASSGAMRSRKVRRTRSLVLSEF